MNQHTIDTNSNTHAHRDPITGEPGSHPIGTGVGAAAGGAAGALVGSLGGPVGTLVGVTVGAVLGGLNGKDFAEMIDSTAEDDYWRKNYTTRAYVRQGEAFNDYGPAYRFGVDSYGRSNGRTFDESEAELMREWERNRGSSNLTWDRARHASRDSWQRVSDSVERPTHHVR
ncbi:MAG: hypothetical protein Q7V56_16715 [Gammaproteobacteria bacterium]|nr:hypothetical protein [Gammaproteobacteria bacterium]